MGLWSSTKLAPTPGSPKIREHNRSQRLDLQIRRSSMVKSPLPAVAVFTLTPSVLPHKRPCLHTASLWTTTVNIAPSPAPTRQPNHNVQPKFIQTTIPLSHYQVIDFPGQKLSAERFLTAEVNAYIHLSQYVDVIAKSGLLFGKIKTLKLRYGSGGVTNV